MSNIRNGKRPISERTRPAVISSDDIFNNPLALDPAMIKAIESKGYSYRLINFKQYVDRGGMHEAHWRPVSRKQLKDFGYDTISDVLTGQDPDGYIRKQDLVLSIRPKEINEKHKAYLRQEAARVQDLQGLHAEELREMRAGKGDVVHEGYDDET